MLGWPNLNGIITKSAKKRISLRQGRNVLLPLSLNFCGNVFVSSQVHPTYALLIPAVVKAGSQVMLSQNMTSVSFSDSFVFELVRF